jgi:hypothetical protein
VRVRVETLMQLRRGGEQSDDENLREGKPHQGREYALPPELTGPQRHFTVELALFRRNANDFPSNGLKWNDPVLSKAPLPPPVWHFTSPAA